jgi:adenylate cyclase
MTDHRGGQTSRGNRRCVQAIFSCHATEGKGSQDHWGEDNMERRLTAILSADVKGESRLRSEGGALTSPMLIVPREGMTALIEQHQGRVVDAPGDTLLAEFASVVNAVQAALAIQGELEARNRDLPAAQQMAVCIGINVGDVAVDGEHIDGDNVNLATRLESLAEPGGICISGTVHDQIETKVAVGWEDLGVQELKSTMTPVHVYRRQTKPGVPAPTVRQEQMPRLPVPDKPSVAVLPFANLSSDPTQEYFSDGLTEDVMTDLSKRSGLWVSARSAVLHYKGQTVKPEQVSQELGVQYVVAGSVRRADSRVRISAQLVDATTGYQLWAERYDRELHDLFAVQDEVTREIVAAVESKLTGGAQSGVERSPIKDLNVTEASVRGLSYPVDAAAEAMAQTPPTRAKARECGASVAVARADLGWTHCMVWVLGWRARTRRFWSRLLCRRTGFAARMALCSHSDTCG